MTADRLLMEASLYTIADIARILDQKYQKIHHWTKPLHSQSTARHQLPPIITTKRAAKRGRPSVPFVGLVEAQVIVLLRECGVPMQRIRPALVRLEKENGLEHALASEKLCTDGVEVLYELGEGNPKLIVVRNNQWMLHEVVEDFLKKIKYSEDGYANRIQLVKYKEAEVVVDPTMSFGQPIFATSGVRVQDVVERLRTGEPMEEVAEDFHTPRSHIEEAWELANAKAA